MDSVLNSFIHSYIYSNTEDPVHCNKLINRQKILRTVMNRKRMQCILINGQRILCTVINRQWKVRSVINGQRIQHTSTKLAQNPAH